MKTILLAGAVGFGLLPSAWAYSLSGPVGNGGDLWQTAAIGYGPPTSFVAPKNLGEEFRRNTPVVYYAYDANFLDYFGSNGVVAVDGAFAILNALTNVDNYSKSLSEFPLETRHINYQAQALGLFDLKSWALGAMVEQMGLADPVEWTWTLHDRDHVGNIPCPVGEEYLVVQRNYDYVSSPLNQLQYSPYINDTLYSYQILEACTGTPVALAVPFSVDPLADIYSPVASFAIGYGDFYTGLTRDDVAGLRYLLQTNNVNWETAAPQSLLFTISTNFSTQQLFPNGTGTNATGTNASGFYFFDGTYGYGDLRALLEASKTNAPNVLQAMYPGLVILSVTNYFVMASNATVTAYFTSGGIGSPYGTIKLVTVTNYTPYLLQMFTYKFANIFTNHYYSQSVSYLQSITVGPNYGSPYPGAPTTNTTSRTLVNTKVPSGDFFVLPMFQTNVCPLDILYTGLTNVTATTNFITSASTNVVTATNTSSYSFTQILVTYFTNYTFVINPVTCSQTTNATGLYQGIKNIKFVRADYDSLLGQYWQPVTNNYTMVFVTNSKAVTQHFQRIVTTPDFLFSAADMATTPQDNIIGVSSYARNLNFDTANVLPNLAGPGTIIPSTTITFEKVGPAFYNGTATILDVMDGTPYFNETPGGDLTDTFYLTYFVWASYDGSTNAPVLYPNGTSIDNLENQVLIQVSPTSVPNGTINTHYTPTTFTATGGSFTPPYTWSATGLPDGLSVSPDGTLSGTPTLSGTFVFTLTLTDYVSRSVQWYYSLTIQ